MPSDARLGRLISISAGMLTAAALVLPPSIYFLLSYRHVAGTLEAEAELNSHSITQIISANPDMWEYEQLRLQEYLSRRPRHGDPERRRVLDLSRAVVAESADPLPAPWITRSFQLLDAGAQIGSIEITRSLRPLLVSSGYLALVLLPLGFLAFWILRIIPLRAIRQSEQALRRERDTAQRYLDVAGLAFVILDRAGRVALVNRKGAEILGRPEAEVIGRDWVESYVEPSERARVASQLSSTPPRGKVLSLEYPVVRPSGEQRVISWYITQLPDDDGAPAGLLASGVDITVQRHLEGQLGHSQKLEALGELASGVAHDFNNIISVIKGFAELLQADSLEGSARRVQLDEILAATDRAASLTGSLLAFSRRQALQPKPVDLVAIVRRIQRFLRHLVRDDIELRIVLPSEPLPVMADAVQLEQVLMNLVANARDAMPDGGRIAVVVSSMQLDDDHAQEVGVDLPGEYARVSVADTGVGMDRGIQARLFEPFFTTKEVGKGTGLGLAIAYGIVKQHRGAISVASEPGHGATFTFLLPLLDATPRLAQADQGPPSRGAKTAVVGGGEAALHGRTAAGRTAAS